jgi:hypothetical protein
MAELESPGVPDELYRYRMPDVPRARPVFQGDVFDRIEIPGLEDGSGLAMVVTHPCTMRQEGGLLRPRLLVCRVRSFNRVPLPWKRHFRYMPLPHLLPSEGDSHWVASFEDIGSIRS